jgi:hypothetical protein
MSWRAPSMPRPAAGPAPSTRLPLKRSFGAACRLSPRTLRPGPGSWPLPRARRRGLLHVPRLPVANTGPPGGPPTLSSGFSPEWRCASAPPSGRGFGRRPSTCGLLADPGGSVPTRGRSRASASSFSRSAASASPTAGSGVSRTAVPHNSSHSICSKASPQVSARAHRGQPDSAWIGAWRMSGPSALRRRAGAGRTGRAGLSLGVHPHSSWAPSG